MSSIWTIFRKEVSGFFNSLVAYVVLAVFLTGTGLFFWVFGDNVLETGQAEMSTLFFFAPWLFLFLVPAITMRSFSEEIKSGTFETLVTKPVTDWQIILGKFFAACSLVILALLPTLIYYFTLRILAQPSEITGMEIKSSAGLLDTGPIWGAYIGLAALGCIFAALGIFSSVVTDNQVVAFILGATSCFFFYYGFQFISDLGIFKTINATISGIGINSHYESISLGVVDTRDILYFVSFVLITLLLTRLVLNIKRR